MAYYAIPELIEGGVATHLNSESFMQGGLVNGAYGALAVDKIVFPSVIVECTKGREQPENSGNFLCDVDIKVYGGMDPNNTGTYIDVTAAHTILHLLGLDHEKLTYKYQGRDFRLTDVHGHVMDRILA